jgi:hypothetical protein
MRSEYYRLEGRQLVACPFEEWAQAHTSVQHVGDTTVKGVRISTVFLGVDHSHGRALPLVFETLVFGGALDQEMVRYTVYDEAEAGHAAMVARVREAEQSELERAIQESRVPK